MRFVLSSDTHAGLDGKTHAKHHKFLKTVSALPDIDLFIHAGDWITHKQSQFLKTIKMFREHIKWPMAAVCGNHDMWGKPEALKYKQRRKEPQFESFNDLLMSHVNIFREYDIHYLENGPMDIKGNLVLGFDGWYRSFNPPTNDKYWLPIFHENVPIHAWMSNRANKSLDKLLAADTEGYDKIIAVTHFPPHTDDWQYEDMCAPQRYLQFLTEKADILCLGHSHKLDISKINDCQILNAGADYNRPRAIVFDTDKMQIVQYINAAF